MIFAGEYAQGVLFSENQLVEKLGISRTPIREALTVLERQGLVEKIPQVGVRVREFSDDDLRETFEARDFLEPHTVRALARKATTGDVEVLEDLLVRMARASRKGATGEFLGHDVEFHWRVAELAGLSLCRDWIRQVGDRIRIVGFISTPTQQGMEIALAEHVEILTEVRKGDAEAAGRATQHHLYETKRRIEEGLGRTVFK